MALKLKNPAVKAAKDKTSQLADAESLLKLIAQSAKSGIYVPDYESDFCRICSFQALCRRGEMSGEIDDEEEEGGGKDE